MRACANCGALLEGDGAGFCRRCAERIAAVMRASSRREHRAACKGCGAAVERPGERCAACSSSSER